MDVSDTTDGVAPSGRQLPIAHGPYTAVVTEGGAALRSLTHDGVDLVEPFGVDVKPSGGHGQLLAPWPNRVVGARWSWAGAEQVLPVSEPSRGHANHGLVRWVAWTPQPDGPSSARLAVRLLAQPGYPWTLDLDVTYSLADDGLTVTLGARNVSATPAPFACGAHPYLVAPRGATGTVDDWYVDLDAGTRLVVDDRLAPTGRAEVVRGGEDDLAGGVSLAGRRLDTAFTDLARDADGTAHARLVDEQGRGVRLWMDERMRWAQLFTADGTDSPRSALAVEPMTSPPDALNSGDDLAVLAPGESLTVAWGIAVVSPVS